MGPYAQKLNKACLYQLIEQHTRYGYTSLETLSTWNRACLKKTTGLFVKNNPLFLVAIYQSNRTHFTVLYYFDFNHTLM